MKHVLALSAVMMILSAPMSTAAKGGGRYFCTDTTGDLSTPSQFYLTLHRDQTITLQYIENNDNSGPTVTSQVAHSDGKNLVAINATDYEGVTTFSVNFNPDGSASTIRTYISDTANFVEKSECSVQ